MNEVTRIMRASADQEGVRTMIASVEKKKVYTYQGLSEIRYD